MSISKKEFRPIDEDIEDMCVKILNSIHFYKNGSIALMSTSKHVRECLVEFKTEITNEIITKTTRSND